MVPLVNGMRDGKAMIVNDGVAYLRLEYKRGSLTGVVERMNEFGAIELRGHLVNGVENGFFEEYDGNDNVVWRGYYKNGRRDPENRNRIVRKGKNTVRSIEHGEFYELDENGKVTQLCLYESGVRSRVVATFSGNTMTELDSDGKRIYEGAFKGSVENGFVREGKGRAYAKGGKMVEYLGEWKNGKRNGVGTEYRGLIALYIGEWKNGMRNGKGKEMDENGRVVFVGEWKDGKGKGKEMDANGNVVYEGEWWNGKRNGVGEVFKGTRWIGYWKDGKMNGMGYEKDGNEVVKRGCLFENGEMKRVVQEFDGGKVVEYDENGKKIYEGEYKGNVEKGFVREGFGKEYRMVEEKITSRAKPTVEIEKKRFCCWVREIEHEVAGVELVTKKYREEVVEGYWKDGKKNGMIYELDENGKAKRGCLYENDTMKRVVIVFLGSEMVEYDRNGKKVYEGKWFGDMKVGFSCHERMEGMSGYYKEVDSSGQLISVSEYDELNVFKNGKCFEMENGKVKRVCIYEKGVMKRVMQEFDGSTMTEYNNGKRVYKGGLKGDMNSGFVREGKGSELDENERVKRVCVYENGRMKRVVQEFNGGKMVEYDENGKKVYEGGFNGFDRNGKGYCFNVDGKDMEVCLYENGQLKRVIQMFNGNEMTENDANGKRVYVGGYAGDVKIGFVRNGKGKEMDGNGNVIYTGDWKNGKRNGEGKEMDASGRVVKSGKWVDGEYQEMIVGNNGYNDGSVTELKLSGLARLKRIVIGNECFGKVRVFELDRLSELESVVIGEKSFTYAKTYDDIQNSKRTDGSYRIVNCPKLKSIQIGGYSFSDYNSFELNNLPSLQSIDIGSFGFEYAPSFSLTDLPQLQSVILDVVAFACVHSIVFENLPKLQSIQLGGCALYGDGDYDRKTISDEPYNYNNTLTMRNLPSLREFKGDKYNFKCIGSVILENIPRLSSDGIHFGDDCFQYTYSLQSSNATALESAIRSRSSYV
ncbi:hypothetical protein WA538_003097 [Blastocystis sp. DL]